MDLDDNASNADPTNSPGSGNAPGGGGSDAGADRANPGPPPAASNQPKAEAFQTAQDVSGEPGTIGSADPQSPSGGLPPAARPARTAGDDERVERTSGFAAYAAPAGALADDDATGAARAAPGSPPASVAGPATPGDPSAVNIPSGDSAAGTSEDSAAVTGIRATAIAPPGKPDGEVDTRR